MELEIIKYKLQKYVDGESSLEDEKLLHDYFSGDDVAAELLSYRDLFTGLGELSSREDPLLEETLMDYILETEHREKTTYRRLWQMVSGIAAILLVALLVINYNDDKPGWKDTYSDPEQAYAEATLALQYVAGKYQKGLAHLQPVRKLNEATAPMSTGFGLVNKGFQQIENLDRMNEKLKNE